MPFEGKQNQLFWIIYFQVYTKKWLINSKNTLLIICKEQNSHLKSWNLLKCIFFLHLMYLLLRSYFRFIILENVHICLRSQGTFYVVQGFKNQFQKKLAATICDRKKYLILYIRPLRNKNANFYNIAIWQILAWVIEKWI